MTSILKSLIGKSSKAPAADEIIALERANQVLQFRVLQIGLSLPKTGIRAAA